MFLNGVNRQMSVRRIRAGLVTTQRDVNAIGRTNRARQDHGGRSSGT